MNSNDGSSIEQQQQEQHARREHPRNLSQNRRYMRHPYGQETGAFAIRGVRGGSQSVSDDIRDDITQQGDGTEQPHMPPRAGQQQEPQQPPNVSEPIVRAALVDEQAEAQRERLLRKQAAQLAQMEREREQERLELRRQQIELQMANLREQERVLELEKELVRMRSSSGGGGGGNPAVYVKHVFEDEEKQEGMVVAPRAAPPSPFSAIDDHHAASQSLESQQERALTGNNNETEGDYVDDEESDSSDKRRRRRQGQGDHTTVSMSAIAGRRGRRVASGILLLVVMAAAGAVAVVTMLVVGKSSGGGGTEFDPATTSESPATGVPGPSSSARPPSVSLSSRAPSLHPSNMKATAPPAPATTSPVGEAPTRLPTTTPTKQPTAPPTRAPITRPTMLPTRGPTATPTNQPTDHPTRTPTTRPTMLPTRRPTATPTNQPTDRPTRAPTTSPTLRPTVRPTLSPTTRPPPTRFPTPQRPVAPAPPPVADTQFPTVGALPEKGISWKQLGSDLSGEAAGDAFGYSVTLSSDGTVLAAGAHYNDGSNGSDSGHVRVFRYSTGTDQWNQFGSDLDGAAAFDTFGYSVALSSDGTNLAVGAIRNDSINGNSTGQVRVFRYNTVSDRWNQLGAVLEGAAAGDEFGRSVALSSDGTILAVGAIWNDAYGTDSGHVRVFRYGTATDQWSRLGADLEGEAAGDLSGYSVALSSDGSILAVGAIQNDGSNGSDSGHVRVFRHMTASDRWNQLGDDLDGEATGDLFGYSVALSSDGYVLAVGARFNDGSNGIDSGHVRVFRYSTTSDKWDRMGADLDGKAADDWFGTAVALSSDGTVLAAGGRYNGGSSGSRTGHVRVFRYSIENDTWDRVGAFLNGEATGDEFGRSVALSSDGTIVAGGAPSRFSANATRPGHVRVFQRNPDKG